MDPDLTPVKPRTYDATGRRAQADRNRAAILDSATTLFLENGYAATTISRVARAAGVSDETVFKAFGGKPGLVRAIWERGLEGAGDVPAERRSDAHRAAAGTAAELLEAWGRLTAEVSPRVAPILLLLRAAAAVDGDAAAVLAAADRSRLERMEVNARGFVNRRFARAGATVEDVRDVLWTYSAPELYELLVVRRGWPVDRYAAFVTEGLKAALLPE
jgi:AcrR family transcriptional regulator